MLRVACHGIVELKETEKPFFSVVEECAREAGFDEVLIKEFANPFDFADAIVDTKDHTAADVVICGLEPSGATGAELARSVGNAGKTARIVLCSDGYGDALEALELHTDGYVVSPIAADDLARMLMRVFRRVHDFHAHSVVINAREGMRRVRISQFMYAETVDHDQVVHLADGTTYSTRISSQAFFDLLGKERHFFKVGSSYIVNVRKVRSVNARHSTATMMDGTVIPVPLRVRKSLEDAILADD